MHVCAHTHTNIYTNKLQTQDVGITYFYSGKDALQHNAAYCNTLQYTAAYCPIYRDYISLLRLCRAKCTATYCNILQHTALYCNPLQHTATHCNTPHCFTSATHCNCERFRLRIHYTITRTSKIAKKNRFVSARLQIERGP